MKIQSVRIQNFRSFLDVTIPFDNYSAFVGTNGVGKSNVLCALNVFFRENDGSFTNLSELEAEDFHRGDTSEPIEITVVFDCLSEDAQQDFNDYFRSGVLIVTAKAVYDAATKSAPVKQFGQRLGMEEFKPLFGIYNSKAKADEINSEYLKLQTKFPELPAATSKDAKRDALHEFERANKKLCVQIPSEDTFYGFSGGSRMERYIQWVYVPAVKDASGENAEGKNTALGKLLARTVRSKVNFAAEIDTLKQETLLKYRELMEGQQEALSDVSKALTERLSSWAHPNATARLAWEEDVKNSVRVEEPNARLFAGEGDFEGHITRFGHGLQRSYIIALLQELAMLDESGGPRLILGCEEPELYQHPPQIRHLASVLQKLSDENAQIAVTTHSPYFVSGESLESVRLVRRTDATGPSSVFYAIGKDIANRVAEVTKQPIVPPFAQMAKLHQILQPHLTEMFFTPKLMLVEGLEDIAYIHAWFVLTEQWDAFRKSGMHIVPANGKSRILEPLIIAQKLLIPTFVMFDADGNNQNANQRAQHEHDNRSLLSLLQLDVDVPFPDETLKGQNHQVWKTNLGKDLKEEVGAAAWDSAYSKATHGLGNPEGSFAKNTVHIGEHLAYLQESDSIPESLHTLCANILKFGSE